MPCPNCGESLSGDCYTQVIHCPYADEDQVYMAEPDANPIYCEAAMTNDQYVTEPCCPHCGSTSIRFSTTIIQIDTDRADQEMSCESCEGTWASTWKLSGFAKEEPR